MKIVDILMDILKELRYISEYVEFKTSEEYARRSISRSLPSDRLVPKEEGSRCVAKFPGRKK